MKLNDFFFLLNLRGTALLRIIMPLHEENIEFILKNI